MADERKCLMLGFVFACFVISFKSAVGSDGILCDEQYCRDYGFDVGCAATVSNCATNNATHSGLVLPSPTLCNCCDFCLAFILEGEQCSPGGPGDGSSVGRCGPGLTCVADNDSYRCRRMESECHSAQDDYDTRHALGQIGFLEQRPRCDDKGQFAPATCVSTQTCFCQSKEGERIFGEAEYRDSNTLLSMQCGCSRRHLQIQHSIGAAVRMPVLAPRCTQDGGYSPVQCDGRTCRCVNRLTGVIESSHEIDLDVQPIRDLPCYDASLDIFPELTPDNAEPPYNYTSPCELERDALMQRILESEDDGYIVDYFSSTIDCLPDGSYERIRTEVDGSKVCTTEKGVTIEHYSAYPGTEDYNNMNCKCAQTSHLLRERAERPACCQNGNFRAVQCRRGLCYCVDGDGRQVGTESSEVRQLACYTDNWRSC